MGAVTGVLVSVIMPVFNAEGTLEETILSVLNQESVCLELLIIDDGSTDGSKEIAAKYAQYDSRVSHVVQENLGAAAARNRGIQLATGEYIAPIDADDLWHPRKLSIQLGALMAAAGECALVYSPCRIININSEVLYTPFVYLSEGYSSNQLAYYNFMRNGSSMMIAKQAAVNVGGYSTKFFDKNLQGCEDLLFALLISLRYKITYTEEILVGYRVYSGSMSTDVHRMLQSRREVARVILSESAKISGYALKLGSLSVCLRYVGRGFQKKEPALALIKEYLRAFVGDSLGTVTYSLYGMKRLILEQKLRARERDLKLFNDYSPSENYMAEKPSRLVLYRLKKFAQLDAEKIE